ncbi:hypothetical protein TVAG_423040 [Trichomonas vaginalis G3]|uniref:Uncharacterized protein n=1 Tax=Trichomonas vaginalis (strain ATCC PRA-98 / G3) TaxID=412133 RepID=A2DTE3_TRIV3|nr:hypothetical protein TVAGG3_0593010 [Trichomonas vaginalis G3]EAY16252.1 hypothetical protein TVAG_423040 [Trichomonas vaginalis G3]KAI5523391.1 hypothetical protein TVAGG3_0593010 [Trichomonas vaginalis G3]|eukprot:XP_001328475.1 hypothetical protein [Trichomonas vaginalis G3]
MTRSEINEACLNATFSAEEVIEELKNVLDKNITNPQTIGNIINIVKNSIVQASWQQSVDQINKKLDDYVKTLLDIANQRPTTSDPQQEEIRIMDMVGDIISYIQIRGGLDADGAVREQILPDFMVAFNLELEMLRRIKWPDFNHKSYLRLRKTAINLFFTTFAHLINQNATHFENAESLYKCLQSMVELDSNGNFPELLIPPIRRFYRIVQAEFYSRYLSLSQLQACVKLMMLTDIDFTKQIHNLPNDPKKFQILQKSIHDFDKNSSKAEFIRNELRECAEKSDNVDILAFARKNIPSEKIEIRFMTKLAEVSSKWLNALLLPDYKEARYYYKQFQTLTNLLSPTDKDDVYESIASSDLGPVFKSQKFALKEEEPMMKEIRAIIAYVP